MVVIMIILGRFSSFRLPVVNGTCMGIYERLREGEQSRRLAWQVVQKVLRVLEILGDRPADTARGRDEAASSRACGRASKPYRWF